ncbi:branched-chain amino acid transport system II carrier protein [uncultured Tessaracoccus sp.]|uniref:branched-chain amino acid transport system II carrier protein n=1 Tax=uncultured Tessaracoccus sp. TaxID=905023 RepID=UPI0025D254B6|nr:branched-chain amino acid transport system II carrier protein [uncultured Tessaracoccus sp.]
MHDPASTTSPTRLGPRHSLLLGSLTFGLFFGAGNLIFPVTLGLRAGDHVVPAALGFLVAAVGLPILGLVASALAGTASLRELAARVGPRFAIGFTAALYLTIGPCFAIPRTATVSYEMAFGATFTGGAAAVALGVFSAVFFLVALWAALHPGRLMDVVGRWLTPLFLLLLTALLVVAFTRTSGPVPGALDAYATQPVARGVLDGYNTMDALASLAFAILILDQTRRLGVRSRGAMAREIGRAGIWAGAAMAAVYVALAVLGATSTGFVPRDENGAVALSIVATHHLGPVGRALAAAIMLVACLKTTIGLISACAEAFHEMAPAVSSTRRWAVLFAGVSFLVANAGLATIITVSVPVLTFLYPLAICLIVLGLLHRWVHRRPWAHRLPVLVAALASGLALLAQHAPATMAGRGASAVGEWLPGFDLGFGWVLPSVLALVVGMLVPARRRRDGGGA